MRLLVLVLPIFLCAIVNIAQSKSVVAEKEREGQPEILPIINEHDEYFKRLTIKEKEWLMHNAILYDRDYRKPGELPEIEQPEIPEIEEPTIMDVKSSDFVPFPEGPETPPDIMAAILNGQIPEGWQRRFTNWLKTDYNLTSQNFDYYRRNGIFCPPPVPSCPGFGDIGGECCPFG